MHRRFDALGQHGGQTAEQLARHLHPFFRVGGVERQFTAVVPQK
jgi:hypothetical protein